MLHCTIFYYRSLETKCQTRGSKLCYMHIIGKYAAFRRTFNNLKNDYEKVSS